MRTNIMVPVNGPKEAHSIVPPLQSLLDLGGIAKVTLVRVVPFAPVVAVDVPLAYSDVLAENEALCKEAEGLLRGIAEQIDWRAAKHDSVVLQGNETVELARFTAAGRFDSVLMVSRTRSWPRRLFSASLAEQILDAVCVPVTVLPGPECVAHYG